MDGTISRHRTRFAPLDFPALNPADKGLGLFDAIFEESDAGLFILDIDIGRLVVTISDANPTLCTWLRCKPHDLRGTNFINLVHEGLDPRESHLLRSNLVRHRPVSMPLTLGFGDKGVVSGHVTIRPVKTARNSLRMVAVLRRDDTSVQQELAMACRQRDAAMQTRERMLARINHDLRTPLNGILGFADMMVHVPGTSGEKMKDYARDIAVAGRELLMRVEDLLTAAQSTVPDVPREETRINVAHVIMERVERVRLSRMDQCVGIKARVEADLPFLWADRGEICRSLDSMLENAICASRPGETVVLACRLDASGGLSVSCEDNGRAIRMNDIDEAVAVTLEEHDVYSAPHIRSVAGLPMAKCLVSRNGGVMHVGTRQNGAGFMCTLSFPAEKLDAPA